MLSNGGVIETKFGTKAAMRMMPELRIHTQRRESSRYHTRRRKCIATWRPF